MESVIHSELGNNKLNYDLIHQLGENFGSSYYLLNVNKLRENYQKIEKAFKSRYANFIIGYSYKTNYLPYLCKELSKIGAYAEVVSRLEYDLAIKIGENPKRIIFNGPLKSKEDIYYALNNESLINIDSMYEVDFVKEYALNNQNKEIKIGLRVNFDISLGGVSTLQEGYEISRFGICVENGNFNAILKELLSVKNIKIIGLHGHFSTRNRSLQTYEFITQTLCNLAKESLLETLEYIDIGGGIYGELPDLFNIAAPTFDQYAETICKVMNREFRHFSKKPNLILEPGISMVANTFIFIAKVIEVKKVRNKNFVLVDGSVHNVKPTMHKNNLPMRVVRKSKKIIENEDFHIVGYTCMEKDYLAHNVCDFLPERDDYIIFENVGAYTIVFNPPFIKERPGIVAMDNDIFCSVRKKETLRQFFNEEIYCF
ncbi:type III PLP-dependent enzyme domain-containing protein [Lederbergia citri]|uniref:Diaminopimelate decarboxylase n=1 Tax=Lederbergia citri TaxID=2833580 RepID=A0A942YJI9_9BACI|nr:diaminopimelate decarboxylase [Lederbergia citri]MBS4197600.1 diaminopimelate decarboxylase [Lederbergia citri]